MCTMQPWRESFTPSLVDILLGYMIACLSGVLLTGNVFIVRYYPYLHGNHNQNVTLFWMALTGTLLSLGISLCFEDIHITHSATDWLLILGHGVSFFLVMTMYIYACAHVPGVIVALIRCTVTVYLLAAQWTVLADKHGGNHNLLELIGAGFVVTGSVVPAIVQAIGSRTTEP